MNAAVRPSHLVVFDAVCVLCCAGLRWIVRHDANDRWRFVAMQSDAGREWLGTVGLDANMPSSFVVVVNGQVLTESSACLAIAREAGPAWRVMAQAGSWVPRGLRDALYRWIARNRYKWFGRFDSCYLPTADEQHRFLGV